MGANVVCKKEIPNPANEEGSHHVRLSLTYPPLPSIPPKKSFSNFIQNHFSRKPKTAENNAEDSSPNGTTIILEGSPSMKKIQMQNSKPNSPDFKINIVQTGAQTAPKFQMGQVIGMGPHGTVNEALSMENGEQVAIKKVSCRPEFVDNIKFYLQKKLLDIDHLNLVNYIEVEELPNSELNIVSELISGSSLESVLNQFGKLKENVCKLFIGQILQGLNNLNKKGSYHGNLKPRNIFIDKNGNVKLGDFFIISRKMLVDGPSRSKPICYLSPEYIQNQTKSSKTDVWALGCLLLEMLTNEKPWKNMCNNLKHIKDALAANRAPEIPKSLSEFCKGFIRKMLIIPEDDRASIEELIEHPFLKLRQEEEKQIDKGFKKMVSVNSEALTAKKLKNSYNKSKTGQQMLFVKLKSGMGNNKEVFGNERDLSQSENKLNGNNTSVSTGFNNNFTNNVSNNNTLNINGVLTKQRSSIENPGGGNGNQNKFLNRMTTGEIRKRNEEERKKFEEELMRTLGNN